MAPSVNPPIRKDALETANSMEPVLIDLHGNHERTFAEEKNLLTAGLGPHDGSANIRATFEEYAYTKEAVTHLKKIAQDGPSSLRADNLLDLINYGHKVCHSDYPPLQPVKDFVKRHEKALFETMVKNVRQEAGASHALQDEAEKRMLSQIPDIESRFPGKNKF